MKKPVRRRQTGTALVSSQRTRRWKPTVKTAMRRVSKALGAVWTKQRSAEVFTGFCLGIDDENLDILFSESFAESGFGQAIMNRLLKAAGHHVEQV